jgi:endonuclease/exonuclease/phosphatase family metal-dependent hydrolase
MKVSLLAVLALCFVTTGCFAQEEMQGGLNSGTVNLNLLSYNIKMLPRILVKRTVRPGKRANYICEKIIADTLDVVVFQEAFDPTIRMQIKRRLRKEFPFFTRPGNMKPGFKFCSGVWMFSKYPIRAVDEVCFTTCDGADCMVHKGGQLCEITMPDSSRIQIMGTHCEAGGSFEMKVSQFYQLKGLMDKHYTDDVPQIACGDFNCSISNKPLYDTLMKILNVTDGPLSGELQYTSDHALNDMDTYNPERRNLIDHFFYRAKNRVPIKQERRVVRYQKKYTKKNSDLSDHFAVKMNLTL